MAEAASKIGLIAGNRALPLILAREIRSEGKRRIIAAGFEGETNPELAGIVDEMIWLKVGQLSKLISTFQSRGVTECLMAGQIAPKNLFDLRPDLRAVAMLLRLKQKNAHTLFGAIADELAKDGVQLIDARPWLKRFMPGPGFLLGPKLSETQRDDMEFGHRVAREVSALEIGQTVVVKNGTVLAVEAFEGTDACLRRGGTLAGAKGGAVAVKVPKKNHDFRFDIPCIGPQTLETCANAQISLMAFEPSQTLLLEMDSLADLARRRRVSVAAAV